MDHGWTFLMQNDMKKMPVKLYHDDNDVMVYVENWCWRHYEVNPKEVKRAINKAVALVKKEGYEVYKIDSDRVLVLRAYTDENKEQALKEMTEIYEKLRQYKGEGFWEGADEEKIEVSTVLKYVRASWM